MLSPKRILITGRTSGIGRETAKEIASYGGFALVGSVRCIALELAKRKIRVNCISPGTLVDTAMTDNLKKDLSPEEFMKIRSKYPMDLGSTKDVAALCIFLLSDESKWLTGQNIVIDGGYSTQ